MILKIRIEPFPWIFLSEGTPSTIYCRFWYFLPFFSFWGEKLHLSYLVEIVFCRFYEIGGQQLMVKEKMGGLVLV
jgi:hypothetical protein